MEISIITPVYYGNKYLNKYMKMIGRAVGGFAGRNNSVEVILVNDSPQVKIEYDTSLVRGFEVRIIENEINIGIHGSRVTGLKNCSGEYVIFLDQDDFISENSLITHSDTIKDADVSLGNGMLEVGKERKKIFEGRFSQRFSSRQWAYVWIRDFIVSPGQCLIRKSSIPEYWKENILHLNGTDDYMLWLLMFSNGIVMKCNYHTVYMHRDTGENYSSDSEKMFESTQEMLSVLGNCPTYKKSVLRLIERRIYYKKADRNNKKNFAVKSIRNIDILLVNIFYRLVWRGCLVS